MGMQGLDGTEKVIERPFATAQAQFVGNRTGRLAGKAEMGRSLGEPVANGLWGMGGEKVESISTALKNRAYQASQRAGAPPRGERAAPIFERPGATADVNWRLMMGMIAGFRCHACCFYL